MIAFLFLNFYAKNPILKSGQIDFTIHPTHLLMKVYLSMKDIFF